MAIEEVGARLRVKDGGKFVRDIRDADQAVDRFGRSARNAGDNVSGLGRLAGGAVGGLSSLGRLASTAAVGVAALTAGAAAASYSLIQLASDAAETESKFNTVFGTGGADQVNAWIRDVQGNVHVATDELQNAASTFGVFGQAVGVPAMELAGFSTALADAGLDLASFSNANPEDVFQALRSGLSGESEPLRQFGIFLSDASLNAFAMSEGIGKTTAEMSEQEKVLLRQRYILANLGAAQGDLERTAGGMANQQRTALGLFRDIRVELGEALMPAMEELMPLLTGGLRGGLTGLREEMPQIQQAVRDFTRNGIEGFAEVRDTIGGIIDNVDRLGFEDGAMASVDELFGPGAVDTLTNIFNVAEDIGIVFRDTLVPAWQGAEETLGPLAGSTLRLLGDGLEWAADNAERLVPWVEALFVTYITSSTVRTVLNMAGALRGLAAAMGLASAAGAVSGGALGAGAGAAARGGFWRNVFGGAAGATVASRLGQAGRFVFGAGTGAAGVATAGVGLAAGGVVAAAHHFGDADRYPEFAPVVAAGYDEPQPMPGEPPPGSRVSGSSVLVSAGAVGSDSWNRAASQPTQVTLNVTQNINGHGIVDQWQLVRALRQHDRVLVEEVQRGLDRSKARD
jgi:hypothetical protein